MHFFTISYHFCSICIHFSTSYLAFFQIFGTDVLQDWAVVQPDSRDKGSDSEMAALNNDKRQRAGEDVKPDDTQPS